LLFSWLTGGGGNRGNSRSPVNLPNTGHGPIEPITEIPAIIDDTGGYTLADWEYVKIGESEGWLVFAGLHRKEKNLIIHRYQMTNIPEDIV
jgi:hypothetical protein